jgi:RHS repeat-associated protein
LGFGRTDEEYPRAFSLIYVTRVIANTTGALTAQTTSPHTQPLHPALQSSYGYTGEPTDPANGLVYLRARHLSPRLGVFPSRDRFEGVTARPLSLNPYAWVEGNVVNATDPSGMCAETPKFTGLLSLFLGGELVQTLQTLGCHELKKNISDEFGVEVIWDEDAPNPSQASNNDAASNAVNQRWTFGEMLSIYNGLKIHREARDHWGLAESPFPTTVQKRYEVGTDTDEQRAALGLAAGNTIHLSARWWGEGQRQFVYPSGNQPTFSIDSFTDNGFDALQYRSWIVIHEMNHVYTPNVEFDALFNDKLDKRFYNQGYFPTRYANNADPEEYLVEAMTGVMWNFGHQKIPFYQSNAGGRTAPENQLFSDRIIYQNTPNPSGTGRFPLVLTNVNSQMWTDVLGTPTSLQQWVIDNLFWEMR